MEPSRKPAPARAALILAGLALMTLYSYARGQAPQLEQSGLAYFLVGYGDGFVRRGLVGQLYLLFFDRNNTAAIWTLALFVHRLLGFAIIAGFLVWLWRIVWTTPLLTPGRLIAIFCIFVASEFYPTLAATAGYMDAYVFLLVLGGFAAASAERYWLAALLGAIAPLIHEMCIFLWVPLVAMMYWHARPCARPYARLAACLAPYIVFAMLAHFEVANAAALQLQKSPLPQYARDEMLKWQFGHTPQKDFAIVMFNLRHYPARAALTFLGFMTPTVAMLALAAGRLPATRRQRLILVMAPLATLAMNLLVWDLTRFLVMTQFTAMLSILFLATTAARDNAMAPQMAPAERYAAIALTCIMLPLPLIYGYFNTTLVIGNTMVASVPVLGPLLMSAFGIAH